MCHPATNNDEYSCTPICSNKLQHLVSRSDKPSTGCHVITLSPGQCSHILIKELRFLRIDSKVLYDVLNLPFLHSYLSLYIQVSPCQSSKIYLGYDSHTTCLENWVVGGWGFCKTPLIYKQSVNNDIFHSSLSTVGQQSIWQPLIVQVIPLQKMIQVFSFLHRYTLLLETETKNVTGNYNVWLLNNLFVE